MKDYENYIYFRWKGKRYRWNKTRLFILCVIAMILITIVACIHVHNVCKQNLPKYDKKEAAQAHEYEKEKIKSIVDHVNDTVENNS